MSGERLFLDTSFIQAMLNGRDQRHRKAGELLPRLSRAAAVWLTEAVMIEVANAFNATDRMTAVGFLDRCYASQGEDGGNLRIVPVDSALLARGLLMYRNCLDKTWGLTNCISFVVMDENGLTDALTSDRHFVQAGFRALMLEEP